MKRIIYTLIFAAVASLAPLGAVAQMKTSYFMEGSIQRLDMNAAFVPQRGYVNIPFIGSLGFDYNSNFLSVRNMLYPNPDGAGMVTFMHGSVDADKFLGRLRNRNNLSFNLRENIFGFGGYAKKYFWSFGLNVRSETSLTVPKDFFRLAKTMQAGEYDLKNFHVTTDNFMEFALGAAFPVCKDVTAGFKVKGLLGLAHARLDVERMNVSLNDDVWSADMGGRMSGNVIGMDFSSLQGEVPFNDIFGMLNMGNFDTRRIGSWGLAFDIGGDARLLNDRLKVSLGLNDIGFMVWSQKSAINGSIDNLAVNFSGYDLTMNEFSMSESENLGVMKFAAPRATTSMLTATLNIGGEYNFLDNRIGVGLLSQTRFHSGYTQSELTVSGNFRPVKWLSASLSHSLIQNHFGVLGFALNIHPSWINLFVGIDYIGLKYGRMNNFNAVPISMKSVNFYFGLAVPLSRPKKGGSFPMTSRRR